MSHPVQFTCVYKTGGAYDITDYVGPLQRAVDRHMTVPHTFACLTDAQPEFDGTLIPLVADLAGWWSIIEVFKITDRPVIFTGLDTVLVGDLDPLAKVAQECKPGEMYMLRPFRDHEHHQRVKESTRDVPKIADHRWASGIMIWNGDFSWIFDEFIPRQHMRAFKMEQKYTTSKIRERQVPVNAIQDVYKGVVSYKHHCRRALPPDARFVLFHGLPRPHQVADVPWVKENWK